jgi:thiamine pyrophosphate-dependent acetolactate synthase large subunit-like protein
MRFDDRVTGNVSKYAKQAKVLHFEIDPSEVNKIIPADVAVLGDAKEALELILPKIKVTKVLTKLITTGSMATSLKRQSNFSNTNSRRLARPNLCNLC